MLALAASVLPVAMLTAQPAVASSVSASQATSPSHTASTSRASHASHAAGTSQASCAGQPKAPACVTITSMGPQQWASPGATLTVSGTLTNSSSQPIKDPAVQLLSSGTPLTGVAGMQAYQASPLQFVAPTGAKWQSSRTLATGSSLSWSIQLRVDDIGMSTFGVYPLVAQAYDAVEGLASTPSYLPYEPARKGADSGTRPAPRQIAWAWPLIDDPMLGEPYQSDCSGAQAQALAASMRNGRLAGLVSVSALADRADVTWAIDPALLINAEAMTACGRSNPALAKAAKTWLADLRGAVKGQQLFFTPYGDVDLALITQSDDPEVTQAFTLGRKEADQILGVSGQGPAAGIEWPADGTAGFGTLESLSIHDNVTTVLLGSKSVPAAPSSVVQMSKENGFMTVLLASNDLTQALNPPSGTAGSAFTTSQLFLAETAELAAADPAQPIIVAPPQRWQPSAGLASSLLKETAAAPWLKPASLSAVAAVKHAPTVPSPRWTPLSFSFSKSTLDGFATVDTQINQIQSYQARPHENLWYALAALESSAWNGQNGKLAGLGPAEFGTVERYVGRVTKPGQVEILASSRVTLGGLKGSVPISIYNKLNYAVRVSLKVSSGSSLFRVPKPRTITVGALSQQQVKLRVQASQVGSGKVTIQVQSADGTSLDSKTMTIRATQFGTLATIILAVALGVFLLASAARTVHRGRVRQTPEPDGAQPDNVVAERTGLGTAGKSAL